MGFRLKWKNSNLVWRILFAFQTGMGKIKIGLEKFLLVSDWNGKNSNLV
jgi:hypothetical protein